MKNYFRTMLAAMAIILPLSASADTVTDEQLDAAYASIIDGQAYRVFTYSEDGTTFSSTKYYLTTSGTLTTDESQAGGFTFTCVGENSGGITDKAFFLKNGANYFTNANKTVGDRIRTATNGRKQWEAQVFYLNDEGYYAVRSTNADGTDDTWWPGHFWTVKEAGIACYTAETGDARFIWQIEEGEASDVVKFDEQMSYTITFNKNITHTMLQSALYNDADDNVLRRTDDADKAMKVQLKAVSGKKNTFTIQDLASQLYITPAADTSNGTNWTLGTEAANIVIDKAGDNIFLLSGENGSKANAYGDDNASEGYRVANWSTGSQWKIEATGVSVDDVTTAISATLNDNGEMRNDKVYDLQGRRVHSGRSIVIMGGRKVLVK